MAHELEFIDNVAQMAYRANGGTPWHGLGTALPDNSTPEQMMLAAGLDWTVSKADTFARVIDADGNEKMVPTGRQALIRDTDGKVLTEVGKGWNPVQNKEAFDFFKEFTDAGSMEMETAGSLHEGRIVWALANVKDGFTLFGGDEVKGYLLFSNPHKFGHTVNIKFCATRVVCQNTLTMSMSEKGKPSLSINHRAKFDSEKVKEILGISHRKLETFKEAAEFLGSKQYTKKMAEDYMTKLFGESNKEDEKLTRTAEKVLELVETQPGADFQKGSFWQLFNGVTYYSDHVAGRSNDTRLTSAWYGPNSKRKLEALNVAVEMAEAA